MIDFDINKHCYGCMNCKNVCPKNAIEFKENKEGFLIPYINKEKCINCEACKNVCPHLKIDTNTNNIEIKECFASYDYNEKEREKSTSGAIFPILAKIILEEKGMICGCVWNEKMNVEHILSGKLEDVVRMRGSKYLQSNLKDCVKQIKKVITKRKVLFVGTPCQVAAVKLYLGEEKNLYTCALFCEGVPSNKVWNLYKSELEKKYKSKIIKVNFRSKEIGWQSPISEYKFENGRTRKVMSYNYDKYVLGFLQGLYYRNVCMSCKYKSNGHNADIIIGDFWGIDENTFIESNNKGVSAIIINSNKGKELIELAKDDLKLKKVKLNDITKKNPRVLSSIELNKNREKFFENIDNVNIEKNIEKNLYGNKYKRIFKEIAYKTGTFKLLKNIFS